MPFEKRLEELFIELPEVPTASGAVVPVVSLGKIIYVGGQFPFQGGKLAFKGRLGLELDIDKGRLASRYALLGILSALRQELGSLNKIDRILQLIGYVASGGDFHDFDRVVDGASQLLHDIFGNQGKHTRLAVGVASLPKGACVELALIAAIK